MNLQSKIRVLFSAAKNLMREPKKSLRTLSGIHGGGALTSVSQATWQPGSPEFVLLSEALRCQSEAVKNGEQQKLDSAFVSKFLAQFSETIRGFDYSHDWKNQAPTAPSRAKKEPPNELFAFFEQKKKDGGRGIWKWEHYFDIYERHFRKFVGQEVHLLEIGIYSGGSLEMWKKYFGPKCHVYGVDIEPACKVYEGDRTKVFIGDQADRKFWSKLRKEVPVLDIVIDDGGHFPWQQIVTLEETLPHLQPDGVFLCEDVFWTSNTFAAYVRGLCSSLNGGVGDRAIQLSESGSGGIMIDPIPFQKSIKSICQYPFVTVIEKTSAPVERLVANKHGTEWQPFVFK